MSAPPIPPPSARAQVVDLLLAAGATHRQVPGTWETGGLSLVPRAGGWLLSVHSRSDTYTADLFTDEATDVVLQLLRGDVLWSAAQEDAAGDDGTLPRSTWPGGDAFTPEQAQRLGQLMMIQGAPSQIGDPDPDGLTLTPTELEGHDPSYEFTLVIRGRAWRPSLRVLTDLLATLHPHAQRVVA